MDYPKNTEVKKNNSWRWYPGGEQKVSGCLLTWSSGILPVYPFNIIFWIAGSQSVESMFKITENDGCRNGER